MILLFHEPAEFEGVSEEEGREIVARYVGWGDRLKAEGKYVTSHKLKEEGGRLVAAEGKGFLVTDGPFAEAKEVLGGYYLVEAESYDAAVEIAKTCPHLDFGRIALREVEDTH
jgi:hypothetical protein